MNSSPATPPKDWLVERLSCGPITTIKIAAGDLADNLFAVKNLLKVMSDKRQAMNSSPATPPKDWLVERLSSGPITTIKIAAGDLADNLFAVKNLLKVMSDKVQTHERRPLYFVPIRINIKSESRLARSCRPSWNKPRRRRWPVRAKPTLRFANPLVPQSGAPRHDRRIIGFPAPCSISATIEKTAPITIRVTLAGKSITKMMTPSIILCTPTQFSSMSGMEKPTA
jgi:hypothetical protein